MDPLLRIGGPATAKNAWIPEFLKFCKNRNVPVDFVSTHHYPTDAFGKTGENTLSQLQHAPPHVMRDDVRTVRVQAKNLPVYYTEWNISSNPRDALHDEPFATQPARPKIIAKLKGLMASDFGLSVTSSMRVTSLLSFSGGFGLLSLHGIAKPIYRVFELLHGLGTEIFDVEGHHETVDAWLVGRQTAATMILTNHAMPRHPIRKQRANVRLRSPRRPRRVYAERVDETRESPGRYEVDG